jgi:hypothetical protein
LNRATASYEHERLKILSYLNGGAAVAFLTLIGATFKTGGPPPCWLAASGAIVFWAAGLFAAFQAFALGHVGQSAYSQAYRKRRQVEEVRRFGTGLVAHEENGNPSGVCVRDLFGIEEVPANRLCSDGTTLICSKIASKADENKTLAERRMKYSRRLSWVSVIFFILGLPPAAVVFVSQDQSSSNFIASILPLSQWCSERSPELH